MIVVATRRAALMRNILFCPVSRMAFLSHEKIFTAQTVSKKFHALAKRLSRRARCYD